MQSEDFEIVHLKNGGHSLRQKENGETFHPGIGPMAEALLLHAEQHHRLLWQQMRSHLVIWDVGLGAAANALAAIQTLAYESSYSTEIHSFDRSLDPLHFALKNKDQLSYILPHAALLDQLLVTRHVRISDRLSWTIHLGDFRDTMHLPNLPRPHSIFYDPYSARHNQDMWNLEHFRALHQQIGERQLTLMSSYSRSSSVRATLLLAGFFVGVGAAIGDKNQSTLASNRADALHEPLGRPWLRTLPESQNANPIRQDSMEYGPISVEDYRALNQHPQFSLASSPLCFSR